MLEKLENRVQRFANIVTTQRHITALRNGMTSTMPILLIGSIFMLISNFPNERYMAWINGTTFGELLLKATDSTFGILAIGVVISISYHLAKHYKIDELSASLTALASYIFMTPFFNIEEVDYFSIKYFGTTGVFVAIFVALISTDLFRWFVDKDIQIKMPESVPPNVAKSFSAFLPGVFIVAFWMVINGGLLLLGFDNIHNLVAVVLSPFTGFTGSLVGILLIIFLQSFFWLFGIHGVQVTAPLTVGLLFQNSDANRLALEAGKELPNIITFEFIYNFVYLGGAGVLFSLALLVFFTSKSKQNKALGKLTLAPVSFQIAEPLIFGLPTVLNPKLAIPFILSPIVSALIVYGTMTMGWVAKPAGLIIPWTTPPILAGYLATGGKISGAVINIITILVTTAIYYPFFRSYDNDLLREEKKIEKQG